MSATYRKYQGRKVQEVEIESRPHDLKVRRRNRVRSERHAQRIELQEARWS